MAPQAVARARMPGHLLKYADMAELADAHGSGPCESNFMEVQVLLSAPNGKNPNLVPIGEGFGFSLYNKKVQPEQATPFYLYGADNRIRTGDLFLTKEVLCLLSYISKMQHEYYIIYLLLCQYIIFNFQPFALRRDREGARG